MKDTPVQIPGTLYRVFFLNEQLFVFVRRKIVCERGGEARIKKNRGVERDVRIVACNIWAGVCLAPCSTGLA